MTPAMIVDLARAIANEQVHQNWGFYLLWLAVIAIAAFSGSWIRSYAADAGKFKAIQRNFEVVLDQLERSTSATTQIQLALNHQDWSTREFKMLRREKLELLLLALYEVREWASQMVIADVDNGVDVASSPINKFVVMSRLYFPELGDRTTHFFQSHQTFVIAMLETAGSVREAGREAEDIKFQIDSAQLLNTPQSVRQAQELLPRLRAAQVAALDSRTAYQRALLPLYRQIQSSVLLAEAEVVALMSAIITP
jgi:hypothetical protein